MRLMLDVHKSSVTACVRIPDEDEVLHQEIREFATITRGFLVLRDWLACFEVRLVGMEAHLLRAGGRLGVVASERPPPQERPRQEDRCSGRRVDLPAGGARAGAPQLRATQRD
jgi:hypothetical protein